MSDKRKLRIWSSAGRKDDKPDSSTQHIVIPEGTKPVCTVTQLADAQAEVRALRAENKKLQEKVVWEQERAETMLEEIAGRGKQVTQLEAEREAMQEVVDSVKRWYKGETKGNDIVEVYEQYEKSTGNRLRAISGMAFPPPAILKKIEAFRTAAALSEQEEENE